MPYAITYTDDVQALTQRGLALCEQGLYSEYMEKVELDDDNDGVPDRIILKMPKVDTAYSPDYPTNLASLCLITLPLRDIIGDPESGYTGFCADMQLEVLAYGRDTYKQVQESPEALAKYRNVIPDVEETDEEGNGTGVFRFKQHTEWDAPVRN